MNESRSDSASAASCRSSSARRRTPSPARSGTCSNDGLGCGKSGGRLGRALRVARERVGGVAAAVLVHLGSANYLERYRIYVTHVQEWQQQFDKLESVDLRYDRQIIVNPDLQGTAKQPPISADAARKAMAAGLLMSRKSPGRIRLLETVSNREGAQHAT